MAFSFYVRCMTFNTGLPRVITDVNFMLIRKYGRAPFHIAIFHGFFGPLLPYYFGAFFILFGENIQSILAAQLLFTFGTTLLIYFICSEFITPALAFVTALWYICFRGTEFFSQLPSQRQSFLCRSDSLFSLSLHQNNTVFICVARIYDSFSSNTYSP